MDLEKVDVVRAEPLEAARNLVEDRLAREPGLVHVVTQVLVLDSLLRGSGVLDEEVALGQDRDPVPRDLELWAMLVDEEAEKTTRHTCLSALPMMRSDSPSEYVLATSQVVKPRFHAASSKARP
jgi:hypothetical protein